MDPRDGEAITTRIVLKHPCRKLSHRLLHQVFGFCKWNFQWQHAIPSLRSRSKPHVHVGQRGTAATPSKASPHVKNSVAKIEGALEEANGNNMPNLLKRARDKSYIDVVKNTIPTSSFACSFTSMPPTSAAALAEFSTPSFVLTSTPSTSVSGLGRGPATRLTREDHPKPDPVSAQAQSSSLPGVSKVMHDGHVMGEWHKLIPGILNNSKSFTNAEILYNLRQAAGIIQKSSVMDYWITYNGQSELLRPIHEDSKPPSSAPHSWGDQQV